MTSEETALSIEAARRHYLATLASRDDLAHLLFPLSGHLPDERTQSMVRMKLFETILSLEKALAGENASLIVHSRFWEPLVKNGSLRNPALIEFAWARCIEAELQSQLAGKDMRGDLEQLPASLLAHPDRKIADLARALLVAQHKIHDPSAAFWSEMPVELLFQISQMMADVAQSNDIDAALNALCVRHDEAQSVAGLARKLSFCLDIDSRAQTRSPALSGIPIFLASLEYITGIAYDRILILVGHNFSDPFAMLLRAASFSKVEAFGAARELFPDLAINGDFENRWSRVERIDPADALDLLSAWSNAEVKTA